MISEISDAENPKHDLRKCKGFRCPFRHRACSLVAVAATATLVRLMIIGISITTKYGVYHQTIKQMGI